MKKVIVIGCPGAGKSTFARKLRDKTGLSLYYLDMLFHNSDGTSVERKAFDKGLTEILEKDSWIIDGNYNRTMEMRLKKCDTAFLLDYPVELCLESAKSRIREKREDFPYVEQEFDEEFKKWISDFPKNNLPEIYSLLEKYKDKVNIVIFKSREEANAFLEKGI